MQATSQKSMKSGLQEAAGLYQRAMKDKQSRDAWIEKYLPLVKSIVSRMRHHFLSPMTLRICMALELRHLSLQ